MLGSAVMSQVEVDRIFLYHFVQSKLGALVAYYNVCKWSKFLTTYAFRGLCIVRVSLYRKSADGLSHGTVK